jgi:hypothetical protein
MNVRSRALCQCTPVKCECTSVIFRHTMLFGAETKTLSKRRKHLHYQLNFRFELSDLVFEKFGGIG